MSHVLPLGRPTLPTRAEWLAGLPPEPQVVPPSTRSQRRIRARALRMVHQYWGLPGEPCCAWCGEHDPRKLNIDHLWSNGAEARRILAAMRQTQRPPIQHEIVGGRVELSTLQILCANCNAEKRAYESERGLLRRGGPKKVLDNTADVVLD